MHKYSPLSFVLWMLVLVATTHAASKPHVVTLGPAMKVKLFVGPEETTALDLKVRALYVDGKLKEFTTGETHDITDTQFAAQRAYRVNDSLPQDERTVPKWKWQRGGWMVVDRVSGRVSQLKLPDFDPFYSNAGWYRDYAAYCGTPDGEKLYAVVIQLGGRKPLVRKLLRPLRGTGEEECARPTWQRQPPRVSFDVKDGDKLTFTVHGRAAGLAPSPEPANGDDDNQ